MGMEFKVLKKPGWEKKRVDLVIVSLCWSRRYHGRNLRNMIQASKYAAIDIAMLLSHKWLGETVSKISISVHMIYLDGGHCSRFMDSVIANRVIPLG
jgi:hypothetical protein